MFRRRRVQALAIFACIFGAVLFIISRLLGASDGKPAGTPPVVIVTVVDPAISSKAYVDSIKENRIAYAKRHGE